MSIIAVWAAWSVKTAYPLSEPASTGSRPLPRRRLQSNLPRGDSDRDFTADKPNQKWAGDISNVLDPSRQN